MRAAKKEEESKENKLYIAKRNTHFCFINFNYSIFFYFIIKTNTRRCNGKLQSEK